VNLYSLLVYIEHNGDESLKDQNIKSKFGHKQTKLKAFYVKTEAHFFVAGDI
jgi:hypothetical protein